jgi:serine/threonine protein kinase
MGAVYEALDERLDTTVALKETLFADERLRKQFEREARLLARMHHPALPRVSDHFAEGDGQFLVMQFIPGDDLSQMMTQKQGPFPPDQVLTWGDQLLDALDYLHTQDPQIIHRDIKPQNLKLTGRGQIILLDFGLAKGQMGGVAPVTTSASIYGYTPNYAPLEQIQGLGTDARSDIYALSATLYHLMTAVKPPDALTRAAALVNGQPEPLQPANELNRAVGPEVANVLARAMSQNRDQRYQTAAAMRAALNGTGEVATLVGRTEAATVLFDAPAPTLPGVAAAEAPTTMRAGETTVVRSPGEAKRNRGKPWTVAAAAVLLVGVLFGGFYAYQKRKNAGTAVVSAPPANTAPTTSEAAATPNQVAGETIVSPSPNSPSELKKVVVESRPNEPVKKSIKSKDQSTAKTDGAPDVPEPDTDVTEQLQDSKGMPLPKTPEVFEPNGPKPDGFVFKRLGVPTTKTLPDGTRVMVFADGTRLLTLPNGTTRVVRPPRRVLRKRGLR